MTGDNFLRFARWHQPRENDSPDYYMPTRDDLADVNCRAIVATCRAVIYGTSSPRPWAELRGGWGDDTVVNKRRGRSDESRARMAAAAREAWAKRKAVRP